MNAKNKICLNEFSGSLLNYPGGSNPQRPKLNKRKAKLVHWNYRAYGSTKQISKWTTVKLKITIPITNLSHSI